MDQFQVVTVRVRHPHQHPECDKHDNEWDDEQPPFDSREAVRNHIIRCSSRACLYGGRA